MKKIVILFCILVITGTMVAQPIVQFDITSSSVNEGAGTLVISASIQNANANPTSVDVNIVPGGTATSGTDFNYAPVTLTFPGGSTASQNIIVTLNDDALVEGDETFTLQLAFPTNGASIGTDTLHTVTIIDNDISTLSFDYPISYKHEYAGVINIPVTLSGPVISNVSTTLHLLADSSTATLGMDYLFSDTTILWTSGNPGTVLVPLSIINDTIHEPDETVRLRLINTSNGVVVSDDTFLLIIMWDDPLPTGPCTELYISEYIDGTGNNKAIEIYNPTAAPVDLHDFRLMKFQNGSTLTDFILKGFLQPKDVYVVANPLASAQILAQADTLTSFLDFNGNDAIYLFNNNDTIDEIGQGFFDPGVNGWAVGTGSTYHHTLVRNIYTYYGDRTWNGGGSWDVYPLDMFDSLGAHHSTPCGVGPPVVGFDYPISYKHEYVGLFNIPISLSNISQHDISTTVHLLTASSTAYPGSDFVFGDTTVTWVAGTSGQKLLPFTIINDIFHEPDETVRLQLINTTAGTGTSIDTFLLIIMFDDTLPKGNCSDLYISEYIDGTGNNKAIEIYNPTSLIYDLHDFRILKSQNGTGLSNFILSGMLAPKQVYVAANPLASAQILAQADTLSSFFDFNGNDAVYLFHVNDTIDMIGQSYIDPGANGWPVDTGSTYHHTLLRSPYHYHGDRNWDSSAVWWKAYPLNMFDSLGAHHQATCGAYVPFPELATINFMYSTDTIVEDTVIVRVPFEVINHSGYPVTFSMQRDTDAATADEGYGRDYFFTGGDYVRDTGVTHDTLVVQIFNDDLVERTESIFIRVKNVGINGMPGADSVFVLYVKDYDSLAVTFYGAGFSYVEKDTDVLVRVLLAPHCQDSLFCMDSSAQIHVTLDAGSATPGVDFLFNDTTIILKTNEPDTLGVWVHIIGDNIPEANEEINFNLINLSSGIHTGIIGYTLRIIDNDNPLGFSEEEFDKHLNLFPNPVLNTLYIETETEQTNVHITSVLGEEVLNAGILVRGRNTIDVSALATGMYFVCVNDSGRLMSKRFVKAE